MKIVHIESGLGNQMLSYCEYLALKKIHPSEDIFIEDIIYEIPECNEVICQWNGNELNRIFKIEAPNIRDLFNESKWDQIKNEIKESQFWLKNWNYAPYITNALNHAGLNLINIRGDFEARTYKPVLQRWGMDRLRKKIFDNTSLGQYIKRKVLYKYKALELTQSQREVLFYKGPESVFTGQRLLFKYNGSHIEDIQREIKESFVFPEFEDEKNIRMAGILKTSNSVFIHARRGDMLSSNGWCYKYGYFKRAVKYIKSRVNKPLFVFFTNTGSIEWCKSHALDIFGLTDEDEVVYVDWNLADQSFRDMQLMSYCKHGIITNSTFGWWGAYFIDNPDKITISPMAEINTTYHC